MEKYFCSILVNIKYPSYCYKNIKKLTSYQIKIPCFLLQLKHIIYTIGCAIKVSTNHINIFSVHQHCNVCRFRYIGNYNKSLINQVGF
jgi:hypothetical protein